MRYPTRAFQSDTTVVSNDRRRHHRVSQTKAAPAPTGAAFTYPLDRSAYISGSQTACPIACRWTGVMRGVSRDVHRVLSHVRVQCSVAPGGRPRCDFSHRHGGNADKSISSRGCAAPWWHRVAGHRV